MVIEGEPGNDSHSHKAGEVWLYRVELTAVEDEVELSLPLSPPEHWDYRNAPLDLVYEVLGIEPELHVGCAVKLPPRQFYRLLSVSSVGIDLCDLFLCQLVIGVVSRG